MKRRLYLVVLLLLAVSLSGCMYPKEMRKENQVASGEYALLVQNAVDQFKEKRGVLPIKNSGESTPIYEKYEIDFKKLQGFLSEPPANAFENGGTASYVLVDVETKPTVKLMDIPSFQKTMDLQRAVDEYWTRTGKLPAGEPVAPGFTSIDFSVMKYKPAEVQSVYSREVSLSFILHESGRVAIDYAPELMRLIDKKGLQASLDPKADLRELLVQESYFVPARSFPYQWKENTPVPVPSL